MGKFIVWLSEQVYILNFKCNLVLLLNVAFVLKHCFSLQVVPT